MADARCFGTDGTTRALTEGALLPPRHRDATAIAQLLPVTHAERAQAYVMLTEAYLLQQRYRFGA